MNKASLLLLIGLGAMAHVPRAQQWMPLDPIGSAFLGSTTWDPIRQRIVLYGSAWGGTAWTEPWFWDGAAWSPFGLRGTSPRPDGVIGARIAWDGKNNRILMFGGYRYRAGTPTQYSDETWTFTGDQ